MRCPISQKIMQGLYLLLTAERVLRATMPFVLTSLMHGCVGTDPVFLLANGHSYERRSIATWLRNHDTCPMTRRKLTSKALLENWGLKSAIRDWQEQAAQVNILQAAKNHLDCSQQSFACMYAVSSTDAVLHWHIPFHHKACRNPSKSKLSSLQHGCFQHASLACSSFHSKPCFWQFLLQMACSHQEPGCTQDMAVTSACLPDVPEHNSHQLTDQEH